MFSFRFGRKTPKLGGKPKQSGRGKYPHARLWPKMGFNLKSMEVNGRK